MLWLGIVLAVLASMTGTVGGATGTSFFGSKEDKAFDIEKLRSTLFRWAVLAYMLVLLAWLAFNLIFLVPRSSAPKGQPFKTGDKWRGLSLGMTAGSIAGNMFCVKAFVEVVQASISEGTGAYWLDWLPYVLFAGAIFFATSNLYFLTKAMREYEALFMGAVFEGTLITAACISGVVVFSELEYLQVWEIILYWTAVLGVIAGIFTVAYGCMTAPTPHGNVQDTGDVLEESVVDITGDLPHGEEIISRPKFSHCSVDSGRSSHSCPFRDVPVVVTEVKKVRQSLKHTTVLPPTSGEARGAAASNPPAAWAECLG